LTSYVLTMMPTNALSTEFCSDKETIISKAVTMVVDNHSDLNVTVTFSYGYAAQPRYAGHLRRMQDTEARSLFSAKSGCRGVEEELHS
jgi:hypothetical protein